MPVYLWKGKDSKKRSRKGEMKALSKEAVRAHLTRLKIVPAKIKEKPKDLFENVAFMQPKVGQADVILFCRQFSYVLSQLSHGHNTHYL